MKKYKNIGTIAIMATLIIGKKDHELILPPGSVCELPSDNLYISRLVMQNHLKEVDEKPDTELLAVGSSSKSAKPSEPEVEKANPKTTSK